MVAEIEDNLSQLLTTQVLADFIGVSASRLQHIFKQEVGVSPMKYIKNLRLQKACELLGTTKLSIKEIRAKVGIKNESHFIFDFKQKFGATPNEYRRNFYE